MMRNQYEDWSPPSEPDREGVYICRTISCSSLKKAVAGPGGRLILKIIRHDWPHSSLPDIVSKLVWIGRLIAVNLWPDDTNKPTPPPLRRVLGLWKKVKPSGVTSARSAGVSFVVSQVSVMPKRSMLLLATRSERAGALSRMERALTVPRRRPRTPGPGLRLTSSAS